MYRESPNIKEIFRYAYLVQIHPKLLIKQKPLRIKETVALTVDQVAIKLQHPDNIAGSFTKNSVLFYEVTVSQEGKTFSMTTEAYVCYQRLSAPTKTCTSKGWTSQVTISKLYAAFRRRAVHNQMETEEGASCTRVVHFMPVVKYNENQLLSQGFVSKTILPSREGNKERQFGQ